ncbi:hypothetical protein D0Z00_004174 [Geotrichum galactomycetum]|uniref:Uncharacterized protein n=1 Tax=Geotrichum galactomycetum TaxID=27317 RepID=A0ACB6UZ45_9ASCO|nr:hypothetical protein D0Z00_004174 [Geotrichum candidum]
MVGIVIYLTNLRRGGASAVAHEWGEVDEHTGINIIAASQVLIVLTFLGVIGLQIGQYWAEIEDSKLAAKAQEEEEAAIAATKAARADAAKAEEPAAAATTKTKPVKADKKTDSKAESTAIPAKKLVKKTKPKSKK